jgi:vacuolar-type H+-ATPase subunit H
MPYDNAYNRRIAERVNKIDREYVHHTNMIGEGMTGGSGFAQDSFMDTGYSGYGKSGGVKRYRKKTMSGNGFISSLGIPVISGLAGMFGLGKSGGGKSGGGKSGGASCCGCQNSRCMGCGKSGGSYTGYAGNVPISGGKKKGRGIVSSIKSLLGFKSKSPAQGIAQHVVSRVADRVPALARARDVVGMVRSARQQFRPAVSEARDRVYREVEDRVVPAVHRARANARNVMAEGERRVRSEVAKAVQEGRSKVKNVSDRARKQVKKVVRQTRRMVEPEYLNEYEDEDYAEELGSGRSGGGKSGGGVTGGRLVPRANLPSSSMGGGARKRKAPKKAVGATDGRKVRAQVVKKVMMEHGMSLPEASKYVKVNGLY